MKIKEKYISKMTGNIKSGVTGFNRYYGRYRFWSLLIPYVSYLCFHKFWISACISFPFEIIAFLLTFSVIDFTPVDVFVDLITRIIGSAMALFAAITIHWIFQLNPLSGETGLFFSLFMILQGLFLLYMIYRCYNQEPETKYFGAVDTVMTIMNLLLFLFLDSMVMSNSWTYGFIAFSFVIVVLCVVLCDLFPHYGFSYLVFVIIWGLVLGISFASTLDMTRRISYQEYLL